VSHTFTRHLQSAKAKVSLLTFDYQRGPYTTTDLSGYFRIRAHYRFQVTVPGPCPSDSFPTLHFPILTIFHPGYQERVIDISKYLHGFVEADVLLVSFAEDM